MSRNQEQSPRIDVHSTLDADVNSCYQLDPRAVISVLARFGVPDDAPITVLGALPSHHWEEDKQSDGKITYYTLPILPPNTPNNTSYKVNELMLTSVNRHAIAKLKSIADQHKSAQYDDESVRSGLLPTNELLSLKQKKEYRASLGSLALFASGSYASWKGFEGMDLENLKWPVMAYLGVFSAISLSWYRHDLDIRMVKFAEYKQKQATTREEFLIDTVAQRFNVVVQKPE